MKLIEYAAALEKSTKPSPSDLRIASYIRTNEMALARSLRLAGQGLGRDDREELVQVAVLAVMEAMHGSDNAEDALRRVQATIKNGGDRAAGWNSRRLPLTQEEN